MIFFFEKINDFFYGEKINDLLLYDGRLYHHVDQFFFFFLKKLNIMIND